MILREVKKTLRFYFWATVLLAIVCFIADVYLHHTITIWLFYWTLDGLISITIGSILFKLQKMIKGKFFADKNVKDI